MMMMMMRWASREGASQASAPMNLKKEKIEKRIPNINIKN
jgi:hypothetical protein